jgi:hypothetical protein
LNQGYEATLTSVERRIKEMDHGCDYFAHRLSQLKVREDQVRKLEVRINESILEIDSDGIFIVL